MNQVKVDYYWRPGCPFCMLLERKLKKADISLIKHNIWDDPEAAAFVRSIAGGNETVPTIAIGDNFWVNPSASVVVNAVTSGQLG